MDRRGFLTAAAGVAGAALWPIGPLNAISVGQSCHGSVPGPVRCIAGVAEPPPMPPQPCRTLCWATCLAYMLRGYGAEIDLEHVLARDGLSGTCRPHDDRRRLLGAAGQWTDARGRPFLVEVTELGSLHQRYPADSGALAVIDRIARQPVLCGAAGHTTLVTEVETTGTALGWLRRERITVVDPFAGSPPLRALTDAELSRPFWMLGLSIRAL